MRQEIGPDGKLYTIFENLPVVEPSNLELLHDDMRRKEKKTREQDWKQRARHNYRKK